MVTNRNYEGRLKRVIERRRDPLVMPQTRLNEVFAQLGSENPSTRYAIQAMQPVDPASTERTRDQGRRVQNQLEKGLDDECDYRFQGSTDQDTHIKAYSDIDLLVITGKFFWAEPPLPSLYVYTGDPRQDIRDNRSQASTHLAKEFPAATVQPSAKSIKVSGGSLLREVDVVPAAWVHTVASEASGLDEDRKVKIFDNRTGEFSTNAPFLIRKRIHERDTQTRGGLRKTIRLMKSLRYDTDEPFELSSFDLSAIAYAMPPEDLMAWEGQDLRLVSMAKRFVNGLAAEPDRRSVVQAPDGSRAIFTIDDERAARGLDHLARELDELTTNIAEGALRSFEKLAEARSIRYEAY